ncbi:MAG TPA: phospholipase A2 [Micromonosporaceae bacterium]
MAPRAPRRVAAAIALGAALAVAWMAPTSTASAAGTHVPTVAGSQPAPERAAAVAIDDITAPPSAADPLAGIPKDFAKVMGYQPTIGRLANGEVLAINPRGGCSVVGGGRPFDLSTVCKAHDLGYDLLRYADRRGDPLAANARLQVDDKFQQDLRVQCGARYRGVETEACDAMAATFTAGVGFNSWRQEYGPPVVTSGKGRTVGVLAFAVLIVYFAGRGLANRVLARRRRRTALRPTLATALNA